LVRVEIEAQKVDETFETVTREMQRHAIFPGFRPGKAPREMVVRKHEKDIREEVKKRLISDSYSQAAKEQKLDILGYPDIEEIQFNRGQALQYAATVETAPDFELPEYRGLPVKLEARTVTESDMERALAALQQQRVTYLTVDRAAKSGDVAVVNFHGTCEGKPIIEIAPDGKGLAENKGFWVEMDPQSFLPGFAAQLDGAKAGEKRSVTVDFPADFVTKELAGKKGVYEVEVVEVKEKVVPAVDEAFAKSYEAENVEKLREGVRRDLENELKYTQERNTRRQILDELMRRVNFELPETAVAYETRNAVYDIVRENQRRGISRDAIEHEKERIYSAATQGAKGRVKLRFLLQKIAEKEKLEVSKDEILNRIASLAAMYQIPPQQFLKDLEKRDGIVQIHEELLHDKAVVLLKEHARIEEVPVGSLSQVQIAPAAPAAPEAPAQTS
jgi:trigger factor